MDDARHDQEFQRWHYVARCGKAVNGRRRAGVGGRKIRKRVTVTEWFNAHIGPVLGALGNWVKWLHGSPLFDGLEFIAMCVVPYGIVRWLLEAKDRKKEREDRRKERHFRAWELINLATRARGDGGRRYALQDLKADGVSLARVHVVGAYLPGIDLSNADLEGADFMNADLSDANFASSNLIGANFENSKLNGTNFEDARFSDVVFFMSRPLPGETASLKKASLLQANLRRAHLGKADLQDANLYQADLQNAVLAGADLQGACLLDANLKGANLVKANLQNAHLRLVDLDPDCPHQEACLEDADLSGADLTGCAVYEYQLQRARGDRHTILPDGVARPPHWLKRKRSPTTPPPSPPPPPEAPPGNPTRTSR